MRLEGRRAVGGVLGEGVVRVVEAARTEQFYIAVFLPLCRGRSTSQSRHRSLAAPAHHAQPQRTSPLSSTQSCVLACGAVSRCSAFAALAAATSAARAPPKRREPRHTAGRRHASTARATPMALPVAASRLCLLPAASSAPPPPPLAKHTDCPATPCAGGKRHVCAGEGPVPAPDPRRHWRRVCDGRHRRRPLEHGQGGAQQPARREDAGQHLCDPRAGADPRRRRRRRLDRGRERGRGRRTASRARPRHPPSVCAPPTPTRLRAQPTPPAHSCPVSAPQATLQCGEGSSQALIARWCGCGARRTRGTPSRRAR